MKRIIISSLAIVAVIVFGLSINSSARINLASETTKGLVQYVVNIHPDQALLANTCPVLVAMTDKSGKIVGLPQAYNSNNKTYSFYEMGPVYGTRNAILINAPLTHKERACILVNLQDSKAGWFNPGGVYTYDLWASSKDIINPDNSTVKE